MAIIKNPMESSTSNYLNGVSLINTNPIMMKMSEFAKLCQDLTTCISYTNSDLNINSSDYYHSTQWMVSKLALIKTITDFYPTPGKDKYGFTTNNWQNLAIKYASDMLDKTPEAKSYIIQTGPCKGWTFENFDKVSMAYLNDPSTDAMKKMWWIDTYASVPFFSDTAVQDVENFFKSACIGMVNSMTPVCDQLIDAPYWLHY